MSNRLRSFLRDLFKAIAVYAAGAWVAIEVVDFAVRQYGLTQFLVNAAVVVAFGGGIVTAVLVWFHGESGQQKVSLSEIVIIGSVAVATGITLFFLRDSDPLDQFNDLTGYRLIYASTSGRPDSKGEELVLIGRFGREYSFAREQSERLLYFAFQPVSDLTAGRLLMTPSSLLEVINISRQIDQ